MEIKVSLNKPGKKFFVLLTGVAVLCGLVLCAFLLFGSSKNPIPASIIQQAKFKTVYPADSKIVKNGQSGYQYQSNEKSILFKVDYKNQPLIVTEQAAPASLANGTGVYFQSIGLHPIAQIQSKPGQVAVVNFYQSGTLEPVGQAGILVAGNTMVIARTVNNRAKLTNEQWKSFFDGLKLAK